MAFSFPMPGPIDVSSVLSQIGQQTTSQAAQQAIQQSPEHKGIFGLHGGLRDVLGTLGDAFLVQGGAKPLYRETRDKEKQSDALQGFVDNPLAAVQKLNDAGYSDEAQGLYKDYATQELMKSKAAYTNVQTNNARTKGYGLLGSIAGTIDPKNYPQMRALAQTIADRAGIPLNLPETYSEEAVNTLHGLGQTAYQQDKLGQSADDTESKIATRRDNLALSADRNNIAKVGTAERVGVATANAITGRMRANESSRHNSVQESKPSGKGKSSLIDRILGGDGGITPTSSKFSDGQILKQNGHTFRVVNGKPTLVK